MIHTVTFNPNNGESNIVVEVEHNKKQIRVINCGLLNSNWVSLRA